MLKRPRRSDRVIQEALLSQEAPGIKMPVPEASILEDMAVR